jgi:hypothetical protein
VTGSQLFALNDSLNSGCLRLVLNGFGLMAYYDEDSFRGRNRARRGNRVADQRLAAGVVENLGEPRLHTRALSRGENDYGSVWEHAKSWFWVRRYPPQLALFSLPVEILSRLSRAR